MFEMNPKLYLEDTSDQRPDNYSHSIILYEIDKVPFKFYDHFALVIYKFHMKFARYKIIPDTIM